MRQSIDGHGVRDTPNFWPCRERERVEGRGKERGKGGKEGGHSLIFTWIDTTALVARTRRPASISPPLYRPILTRGWRGCGQILLSAVAPIFYGGGGDGQTWN